MTFFRSESRVKEKVARIPERTRIVHSSGRVERNMGKKLRGPVPGGGEKVRGQRGAPSAKKESGQRGAGLPSYRPAEGRS